MSRTQQRLGDLVDPNSKAQEEPVFPADHVDIAGIERGSDDVMADVVEDINEERGTLTQIRNDNQQLRDIAVSLEQFTLLAMEGLNEGTGLEPQTLLAIQYGANQHLSRVGELLEFPSLESEEMGPIQKTVLSVEGLGDMLSKIWSGLVNAATRAGQSIRTFFKHMVNFHAKIYDKAKALKSQLMAIDQKAEGPIKTSAAKRLFYGEPTFRTFYGMWSDFFTQYEGECQYKLQSGLKRSNEIVKELTKKDSGGLPALNPKVVRDYILNEQTRRGEFMKLGFGSQPRQTQMDDNVVNLKIEKSHLLMGGYRFVSHDPVLEKTDASLGDAIAILEDCSFELEADKVGNAPSEMPVLSIKDAIKICDQMMDLSKLSNKVLDSTVDESQPFWKLEDESVFEKAFDTVQSISKSDTKKIQEIPGVSEAIGKGMSAGVSILTRATVGVATYQAIMTVMGTGSIVNGALVFIGYGTGMFMAYLIPSLVIGGALGVLFRSFMTPKAVKFISSDDPNAPMLYVLRGLISCRSWIGAYSVDTIYALTEYYAKIATPLLDYMGDSAKAHLAAAKAKATESAPATA